MQLGFAIFVSSMLMAIAAVHVYWAFGGAWPASEGTELPQTVVGTQGSQMPQKAVTLAVVFAFGAQSDGRCSIASHFLVPCGTP